MGFYALSCEMTLLFTGNTPLSGALHRARLLTADH
jgi:hypothetical protein